MARRLCPLDPQSSATALFGAELRALRQRRGPPLAGLGELVHVSGDLLGKIEKAERRPQPDLIVRLDGVLSAEGLLKQRGDELLDDVPRASCRPGVLLTPATATTTLRTLLDDTRASDHAMRPTVDIGTLVEHARSAQLIAGQLSVPARQTLESLIGWVRRTSSRGGWRSMPDGRPGRSTCSVKPEVGRIERRTRRWLLTSSVPTCRSSPRAAGGRHWESNARTEHWGGHGVAVVPRWSPSPWPSVLARMPDSAREH